MILGSLSLPPQPTTAHCASLFVLIVHSLTSRLQSLFFHVCTVAKAPLAGARATCTLSNALSGWEGVFETINAEWSGWKGSPGFVTPTPRALEKLKTLVSSLWCTAAGGFPKNKQLIACASTFVLCVFSSQSGHRNPKQRINLN